MLWSQKWPGIDEGAATRGRGLAQIGKAEKITASRQAGRTEGVQAAAATATGVAGTAGGAEDGQEGGQEETPRAEKEGTSRAWYAGIGRPRDLTFMRLADVKKKEEGP